VSGFERPVSPTEWLYLAGARVMPPFAIQLVVEGRGRIDRDGLARAVAVASDACPGVRLVRRGRTWIDSGEAPPVREVAAVDFHRPLDPDLGPTCEVLLAPAVDNTTQDNTAMENAAMENVNVTLVFRAFHGVMDGRGVLAWAGNVFRALPGEEPAGAPSRATDYSLLQQYSGAAGGTAPCSSTTRSTQRPRGTCGW
jgi:hypothetical protein